VLGLIGVVDLQTADDHAGEEHREEREVGEQQTRSRIQVSISPSPSWTTKTYEVKT
jgi:hypothetical protein